MKCTNPPALSSCAIPNPAPPWPASVHTVIGGSPVSGATSSAPTIKLSSITPSPSTLNTGVNITDWPPCVNVYLDAVTSPNMLRWPPISESSPARSPQGIVGPPVYPISLPSPLNVN